MPTIRGSIDWVKKVNFKTDKTDQTGTDRSALTPYPLQFANCVRIENNDAVYIFDEVGAGKTISAGLMLLHYLYNHPGQKALIITTNALARSDDNGSAQDGEDYQGPLFLKEWHESLKALGMEKCVKVVNNNYANINSINDEKKKSGPLSQYGMIIIDEAQEFLNQETVRYKNLVDTGDDAYTLTERVVFLSATPIKRNWLDLEIYREIAARLLHKPFPPKSSFYRYARENFPELYPPDPNDRVQQEKFLTQILAENPTLNQMTNEGFDFDAKFPATRYFKDTVNSLTYPEPSEAQSRERDPRIWEWNSEKGKLSTLLEEIGPISRKTEGGKINRFVIFVRLVKDEADRLGEELRKHLHFPDGEVKVITGSNSGELRQYTTTEEEAGKSGQHLPQVLILTYQIAEAGVNLPAYNYVVNYHIPPYPSSLEQRFGRIDRLNSGYPCIHTCYLLNAPLQEQLLTRPETYLEPEIPVSWKWLDTSTYNFCQAIGTYLNGLLPYLPSRNTLLTPEVAKQYKKSRQDLVKRLSIIEKTIEQGNGEALDGESWDELLEGGGPQKKLADRAKDLRKKLESLPDPEQYEELLKDQNPVYYYEPFSQSDRQSKSKLRRWKLNNIQNGIQNSDAYQAFRRDDFQKVLDMINGSGSAAQVGEDIPQIPIKRIAPINEDIMKKHIGSCHRLACKQLRERINLGREGRFKLMESLYLTRIWVKLCEANPDHIGLLPDGLPEAIMEQIGRRLYGWMGQDYPQNPIPEQNCLALTLEDDIADRFWGDSWDALCWDIYHMMSNHNWLRESNRRKVPPLVLEAAKETRIDFQNSSCVGAKRINYMKEACDRADKTVKSLPNIDGGAMLQIYADAQKRAFRAAVTDWFQWMMKRYDWEVTRREHIEMGEIMDGLYWDGKLYLNNHLKLIPKQDIVHAAEQRLASFPQSVRKYFCDAVCETPADDGGRIKFTMPVKEAVKSKMHSALTAEQWKELRRMSDFGTHLVELYAELFDKTCADMPHA